VNSTETNAPQTLQCHPATPAGLPLDVSVAVSWTDSGLQLRYSVVGDTTGLRLPPAASPGPADGLWQHTCLEAFIATEGGAAYREFNFSPSGRWAAYRFASERVRASDGVEGKPTLQFTMSVSQLVLTAHLSWDALPQSATLCIGLSAVIEESSGNLSYWALQHPGGRPDFHHPAGRALRLVLPQN
jgi:hypothetical protein